MRDRHVSQVLRDLVLRYDLLLVLEVTDASGEAAEQLLDMVNDASEERYALEASPRLGNGKNKEQMVFFYKEDRFNVSKSSVYDDANGDFLRPPFAACFTSSAVQSVDSIVLVRAKGSNIGCCIYLRLVPYSHSSRLASTLSRRGP